MIFIIFKRELKVFFRSPLAYVMCALFSLIIGWVFFNQLVYFVENVQKMPVHLRNHYDFANEVIIKMFGNINFMMLFFIPILTMKSFAQEYRNETINIYYCSRISDFELIMAKYLSYFVMGAFLISTTFVFPLFFGNIDIADVSFLILGILGLFLNMACYISLGIFGSSLSKNQILAALLSFVLVFFTWMVAMLAQSTSNHYLSELLRFLSINHHFQNLAKGKISFSDISFYLSFIVICLLMIRKRLDMRNWR